ncbi:MAG: hypothetical protein ACI8PT_004425 [Gammaproteobacteria bacterium]|jgi:hypothetical protein
MSITRWDGSKLTVAELATDHARKTTVIKARAESRLKITKERLLLTMMRHYQLRRL